MSSKMLADVKPEIKPEATPAVVAANPVEVEITKLARQIRVFHHTLNTKSTVIQPPSTSPPVAATAPEVPAQPQPLANFGWAETGNMSLPFVRQNNECYVANKIYAIKVIDEISKILSNKVIDCATLKMHPMSKSEADVFNEINVQHCDGSLVGNYHFVEGTFMSSLEDVKRSIKFFETCKAVLCLNKIDNDLFGFIKIAGGNEVPFIWNKGQKLVPLFYFEGQSEYLDAKSIDLTDSWQLGYLKFCCLVQNIRKDHYEQNPLKVVNFEHLKTLFPEGTTFELYWPKKSNQELLAPELRIAALHGVPQSSLLQNMTPNSNNSVLQQSSNQRAATKRPTNQQTPATAKKPKPNSLETANSISERAAIAPVESQNSRTTNVPYKSPPTASSPECRLFSPPLNEAATTSINQQQIIASSGTQQVFGQNFMTQQQQVMRQQQSYPGQSAYIPPPQSTTFQQQFLRQLKTYSSKDTYFPLFQNATQQQQTMRPQQNYSSPSTMQQQQIMKQQQNVSQSLMQQRMRQQQSYPSQSAYIPPPQSTTHQQQATRQQQNYSNQSTMQQQQIMKQQQSNPSQSAYIPPPQSTTPQQQVTRQQQNYPNQSTMQQQTSLNQNVAQSATQQLMKLQQRNSSQSAYVPPPQSTTHQQQATRQQQNYPNQSTMQQQQIMKQRQTSLNQNVSQSATKQLMKQQQSYPSQSAYIPPSNHSNQHPQSLSQPQDHQSRLQPANTNLSNQPPAPFQLNGLNESLKEFVFLWMNMLGLETIASNVDDIVCLFMENLRLTKQQQQQLMPTIRIQVHLLLTSAKQNMPRALPTNYPSAVSQNVNITNITNVVQMTGNRPAEAPPPRTQTKQSANNNNSRQTINQNLVTAPLNQNLYLPGSVTANRTDMNLQNRGYRGTGSSHPAMDFLPTDER